MLRGDRFSRTATETRSSGRGLVPSLRAALSSLALVGACTGGDRGFREGAWEFKVDTVRATSDAGIRLTTWLRAVGKEGPQGEPQTKAVMLSFDCLPGHTSTAIMTDQALRQGSVEVRLKLDASPPRRLPGFSGTTATGGQLVLTVPQDSVLALLGGHQQATIEYADGAGSSKTTAVFAVAGVEKFRAVPGGVRQTRRQAQLDLRARLLRAQCLRHPRDHQQTRGEGQQGYRADRRGHPEAVG
jgi:hypothetical protein